MDQIERIKQAIEPLLNEESILLHDVQWVQENKMKILQISIIREDGSIDLDACSIATEKISQKLDELDMIQNEYYLEVCSPGAERVLRTIEEVKNEIGSFIYIKFKQPTQGMNDVKGTLKDVQDQVLSMEYMNKAVRKKITLEYENIALIRLSVKI